MLKNPVLRATFACAFAVVTTVVTGATATAATIDLSSFDSGYYSNSGATPDNNNIIDDSTRNNYFAFDLSGVTGTITGAVLTILGGNGNTNAAGPNLTYTVYDVSTNVGLLTTRRGGAQAFTDLGSGTVYGSAALTLPAGFGAMPEVAVNLSGALGDLNAARGGLFAVGGTGNQTSGFLWISSSRDVAARLTLTTEPAVVPVPAALPLLAGGLGALALAARRKRRG